MGTEFPSCSTVLQPWIPESTHTQRGLEKIFTVFILLILISASPIALKQRLVRISPQKLVTSGPDALVFSSGACSYKCYQWPLRTLLKKKNWTAHSFPIDHHCGNYSLSLCFIHFQFGRPCHWYMDKWGRGRREKNTWQRRRSNKNCYVTLSSSSVNSAAPGERWQRGCIHARSLVCGKPADVKELPCQERDSGDLPCLGLII